MLNIKIIKLIHTAIWAVMAGSCLYILYASLTRTYNWLLWLSIIMVCLETIVLLINKWTCPLTSVARQYTNDKRDNFDIYLPKWLAKYNKLIFGTIFVTSLLILLVDWLF